MSAILNFCSQLQRLHWQWQGWKKQQKKGLDDYTLAPERECLYPLKFTRILFLVLGYTCLVLQCIVWEPACPRAWGNCHARQKDHRKRLEDLYCTLFTINIFFKVTFVTCSCGLHKAQMGVEFCFRYSTTSERLAHVKMFKRLGSIHFGICFRIFTIFSGIMANIKMGSFFRKASIFEFVFPYTLFIGIFTANLNMGPFFLESIHV